MRDSYMQVWNRIQFQLQCNWIFFKFEIHFFFLLENQLCKIDNGGCSYLCLLTPNGSVCACPDGSPLSKDGKRCLAGKNFLIGYCHRFTSRWFWFECPNKNFTKPKLKPGLNNSSEDTVLIRGGQIYQCRSLKSDAAHLGLKLYFWWPFLDFLTVACEINRFCNRLTISALCKKNNDIKFKLIDVTSMSHFGKRLLLIVMWQRWVLHKDDCKESVEFSQNRL